MRRSVLVEGYGIPLGPGTGRDPAPRPNLAGTHPGPAGRSRPAPDEIAVHLDAGYDSEDPPDPHQPRAARADRAQGREDADPGQPPWHLERTNAWHNAFNRFQRCYERREKVIDAFFDLADAIITVRGLIRRAWITHRWDTRPTRQP
jgi:hypothetical protein